MDTILDALHQAALYEHVSGNEVEVVVVNNKLFYKILRMGMVEVYKFPQGPTYAFVPLN